MHSVTDRQTDGQQDDANSRSYCVVVRSAKNAPVPAEQPGQNYYFAPDYIFNKLDASFLYKKW